MRHCHLVFGVVSSALIVAAGCKPTDQPTSGDGGGSTGVSSVEAGSTTVTSTDTTGIVATCLKKQAGTCDEYYGALPKLVPETCSTAGGEFKKATDACPKENRLGTCHYKPKKAGEAGQDVHFYAGGASAEAAKNECMQLRDNDPTAWTSVTGAAVTSPTTNEVGSASKGPSPSAVAATAKGGEPAASPPPKAAQPTAPAAGTTKAK